MRARFSPETLQGPLFLLALAAACFLALSLPVFPTQDGPAHRYYIHVLGSLLRGGSEYPEYRIRHPFPPYATHYGILLLLSRFVSFDIAEKLLVCGIFAAFAFGLRAAARSLGPAGKWTPLFFTPLLFSWPLMMGFFNYIMGVCILLGALFCWQRSRGGARGALPAYLGLLVLLALTHPVPLLFLIAITGFDLLLNWFLRAHGVKSADWFRRERARLLMLLGSLAAAGFPLLAVDKSAGAHTHNGIHGAFDASFALSLASLLGISPYNARSHDLAINAYRLLLYAVLLAALWVGLGRARAAFKERRPDLAATLAVFTLLLALVLPCLPDEVNGSSYFATRLNLLLWPLALLGASSAPSPSPRARAALLLAAFASIPLSLVPANTYFRPAAQILRYAEQTALPARSKGLLLLSGDMHLRVRFEHQLMFNPFQWGGMMMFLPNDAVAINGPWLELKITPVAAAEGSPLMVEDLPGPGVPKEPFIAGRPLSIPRELQLERAAEFFVFTGPPDELAKAPRTSLPSGTRVPLACEPTGGWWRVCRASP